MTMTTKELLALVEKWRELAATDSGANDETDRKLAFGWDYGLRQCADELAPIATALCAEVEALKADLAACHRYVAARDAFDYAAEKYGEESNCASMKPMRREVLAAVKEYRAVLAKEPK